MPARLLSRRRLLESIFALPISAAIVSACGDSSETAGPTAPTLTLTTDQTTTGSAVTEWASGGTELISVPYPETSIFSSTVACAVSTSRATAAGPCYFASDTDEDISLDRIGLPMQVCFQLIDSNCDPLANHVIEAWHCDNRGVYSGDTSNSADASEFDGEFCTDGDQQAQSSSYLRGQRTTDSQGRANFKSIFPGWYPGRTIHIHVAITDPQGSTRLVSQFGFTDEVADEICATQEHYADRGVQDTPLSNDVVFPSDPESFLMATRPNTDGTLLAVARIQVDAV